MDNTNNKHNWREDIAGALKRNTELTLRALDNLSYMEWQKDNAAEIRSARRRVAELREGRRRLEEMYLRSAESMDNIEALIVLSEA